MIAVPSWVKIAALVMVIITAFSAGWRIKAAFVAERDLAIMEARDAMIAEYRVNEAGKAQILENKLADLRANERVIEREKLKIINRDVYHNECLDVDGLRLIEAARAGKTDPAKPADEVSGTK